MPCPAARGKEGPLVLTVRDDLEKSTSRLRVLLESKGNLPDVKAEFDKEFCPNGLVVVTLSLIDMLLGARQWAALNIRAPNPPSLWSSEWPSGASMSAE